MRWDNSGFPIGRSIALTFLLFFITCSTASVFAQIQECPSDTPDHKSLMEYFLTESKYEIYRAEHNIPGNALSSLRTLGGRHAAPHDPSVPTDNSLCQTLNTGYSDEFPSEENPDPYYHSVYYTAGGFYFVVVKIRPHSDPNRVRFGLEYVVVYDSNLNRLMGYTI